MAAKRKSESNIAMQREPEKFLEHIAMLKGSNKELQAAAALLSQAAAGVNTRLVKRSTRLARRILAKLRRALPSMDQQVLGDFVAEVIDLWGYGQELDKTLKEICELRIPQQRAEVRNALISIEVQQFDYALDCIKGLQKSLPQLKRALNRNPKGRSNLRT